MTWKFNIPLNFHAANVGDIYLREGNVFLFRALYVYLYSIDPVHNLNRNSLVSVAQRWVLSQFAC